MLNGVDNICVSDSGEVLVCEDHGGEQDIVMVSPDGSVGRIVRVTDQPQSELTGVVVAPPGDRIYFSSQRGGPDGLGITYEVRGPFRDRLAAPTQVAGATTPTSAADALGAERAPTSGSATGDGDDGSVLPLAITAGVGALLAVAAAGAWRLRNRRAATEAEEASGQTPEPPAQEAGS